MDEVGNLKLKPQDLSDIASAVVKDASVANPKVRFLAQSSTAAKANIDGDRIKQVLTNLVNNAGRFAPEGSEVLVSVSNSKGTHRLEVVDHGEGIPEMLRDKVFDRFYRADTSRNRETGGSGLGLAIAQTIVEGHDGRIWIEETPGGGATFVIELPTAGPKIESNQS